MSDDDLITVEVAYARPDVQCLLEVKVLPGTTLVDVVRRSGMLERFPEIDIDAAVFGIFGRVVKNPLHVVHPFDRVEIYRPLPNDPKDLRAARAQAQRAKEE